MRHEQEEKSASKKVEEVGKVPSALRPAEIVVSEMD